MKARMDKRLKHKRFCLRGKGSHAHSFPVLAIICSIAFLTTNTDAQMLSLESGMNRAVSASDFSHQTKIESDDEGIRVTESFGRALSKKAKVSVRSLRSISQGFGSDLVDQTIQRGIEIRFDVKDRAANLWVTRIQSTNTQQDILRFSGLSNPYLFQHKTYQLAHGWQRELREGLAMELFAGVVQCQQADHGASRIQPVGGVRFFANVGRGYLVATLSQGVEGGGSFSSVYGSQLLRQADFAGSFPIVSGLSLQLDCEISLVRGMFEEDDLVRSAPVIVASASLKYQFSSAISGSVGYAHRRILGGDGFHGTTGPMATAAFTAQLF